MITEHDQYIIEAIVDSKIKKYQEIQDKLSSCLQELEIVKHFKESNDSFISIYFELLQAESNLVEAIDKVEQAIKNRDEILIIETAKF